jgi:cytochrome c peroxidase
MLTVLGSRGPLFVRLAWHASGTYDRASGTGGSDGATMRYAPESTDGANNGLTLARDVLAPLKKKYPHASFADIWTLAGVVAIEEASSGACIVPWKPGRSDIKEEQQKARVPANGRLPDAAQGAAHVRAVFGRMGFDDAEMVALIGAHALGRCHMDRSGYDGPWSPSPTMFSNDFYQQLIGQKWVPKTLPNGVKQFVDAGTGALMMTPADLAFLSDPKFRVHVDRYAADEQAFFKDFSAAFSKLLDLGVKRTACSK